MPTNNGNGNGTELAARPNAAESLPVAAQQFMELPPWMKALREAMEGSISGDDVKDVMAAQVRKAKEGDMRAAAFVMTQAHKLMEARAKQPPVTIVQNNYYDAPSPNAPIHPGDAADGSDLRKMQSRARAGLPLAGNPADRRHRQVTDEEEKANRRREEEAAK